MIVNSQIPVSAQTGTVGATAAGSTSANGFGDLLQELSQELTDNPFQGIIDAVLKEHGLTAQQYQNMSGPEKTAIDKEIAAEIKRAIGGQKQTSQNAFNAGLAGLHSATADAISMIGA